MPSAAATRHHTRHDRAGHHPSRRGAWFLREGAPWLVRGAKPGTALARMLPFTVLIGVAGPLFTVLGAVLLADDAGTVDLRPDDSLRLLLVLLLGVVAAILMPYSPLGLLNLAFLIAAFVYLADVRPALKGLYQR